MKRNKHFSYISIVLMCVSMLLAACGKEATEKEIPSAPMEVAEVTNPTMQKEQTEATSDSTNDTTIPAEEKESVIEDKADQTDTTERSTESAAEKPEENKPNTNNEQVTAPTENNAEAAKPTDAPATSAPANPPETQPPTTPPADYTLKLSASSVSIEVGESKDLAVTYTGEGTLTWSSSNTGVANVSGGKVSGVTAGTAYVTVSDGTKNATVTVTVKAKPIETQPPTTQPTAHAAVLDVLVTKPGELTVGSTYQVEYSYTGNASNLSWTSNDTSVATVNSSGVVTAVSAGQALIKVTDGTTTKRCTINVVAPPAVYATSIEFRGESGNMHDGVTKTVGDSYSARLVVKPNEANQDVYVSSSNSSVVSISYSNDFDYTHVSMSFNGAGTATVTFTSGDGAVSMSYTITVKDKEPVSSSELSPEAFASAIEQTLVANGFTIDRTCSGWTQATYSASELTASRAASAGNNLTNQWWEIGHRYCNIQYAGQNANGDYVFHFGSG